MTKADAIRRGDKARVAWALAKLSLPSSAKS